MDAVGVPSWLLGLFSLLAPLSLHDISNTERTRVIRSSVCASRLSYLKLEVVHAGPSCVASWKHQPVISNLGPNVKEACSQSGAKRGWRSLLLGVNASSKYTPKGSQGRHAKNCFILQLGRVVHSALTRLQREPENQRQCSTHLCFSIRWSSMMTQSQPSFRRKPRSNYGRLWLKRRSREEALSLLGKIPTTVAVLAPPTSRALATGVDLLAAQVNPYIVIGGRGGGGGMWLIRRRTECKYYDAMRSAPCD